MNEHPPLARAARGWGHEPLERRGLFVRATVLDWRITRTTVPRPSTTTASATAMTLPRSAMATTSRLRCGLRPAKS